MSAQFRGRVAPSMAETPVTIPRKQLTKEEFGRRLESLILERGWNQSEAARQASKHLPKDKPMGRDSVSNYVRGRVYPNPPHLSALAKALGLTPEDILPNVLYSAAEAATPTLEMRAIPGHPKTVWLRINQQVPFERAVEIMRLLGAPEEPKE